MRRAVSLMMLRRPVAAPGCLPRLSLSTSFNPQMVIAASMAPFSMKEHAILKRKQRDNEKFGINEEEDENALMMDEEEKRKLDEEEEKRRKELEEATAAMLKEREAKDKLKKEKFNQWRSAQIKAQKELSANRKKGGQDRVVGRTLVSEVSDDLESKMEERGDFKETEVEVADIDDRRKVHRAHKSEMRRLEREE